MITTMRINEHLFRPIFTGLEPIAEVKSNGDGNGGNGNGQ